MGSLDRSCQRLRASFPKKQQTIISLSEKGVVDEFAGLEWLETDEGFVVSQSSYINLKLSEMAVDRA